MLGYSLISWILIQLKLLLILKYEQAINSGNNTKAIFWQEQLKKIFSDVEPIKIQIAQFNAIVGDIESNAQKNVKFDS